MDFNRLFFILRILYIFYFFSARVLILCDYYIAIDNIGIMFSVYNDYGVGVFLWVRFWLRFFIALMNVVIFTTFFDFSVPHSPLLIPDDLNLPRNIPEVRSLKILIKLTRIRLRLLRNGR